MRETQVALAALQSKGKKKIFPFFLIFFNYSF